MSLYFPTANGIETDNFFYFIAKKRNPIGKIVVRQMHVHRIALHPKSSPIEIRRGSAIQTLHQTIQQRIPRNHFSLTDSDDGTFKIGWISRAINTTHTRHHNDIAPSTQQTRNGFQTQLFNFIVDVQILFDVGPRSGDVGLRLVIIVITHKIFHRIVRKKLLEFPVKLRNQRFIVTQYQRGPLGLGDHIRHRKGLSRPRNPQQSLRLNPRIHALHQLFDGVGLVARRLKWRYQFKGRHEQTKLAQTKHQSPNGK